MSRTKYGLKAAATYSLPEVKMIIEDQCQKKHLVCPNLEKGLLNKKAREYGLRPSWNNGIPGHGYREKYLGESVIIFIDMFILDLKGEKEKTKLVQTRKSAAAHKQDLTPIEELAKSEDTKAAGADGASVVIPVYVGNELYESIPFNPYKELFSLINNCITELSAIRDKLEYFVNFGG